MKNSCHQSYFLMLVIFSINSACFAQAENSERRIERFYVSATNGIVFPVTGDYKNMKIGYNYILKGGWHWKLSSRGGFSWSISYSNSQSRIERNEENLAYSYYPAEELQDISIRRFDVSLLNPFLLFGKNNEGYFHVSVDLVFNQNIYRYEGYDYNSSNHSLQSIKEKGPVDLGLGTQYGIHIPVSDHFGIAIDAAFLLIKLERKTTSYVTYSTKSTTSNGIYGYANVGLVYGIW